MKLGKLVSFYLRHKMTGARDLNSFLNGR